MGSVRLRFPSASDFSEDSVETKMEKKRPPSEAWTPTKGLDPAFDYHTPDSKDAAMGPPKTSTPEEVPTWNEFTQSTTIHGVKYIFDSSSHRHKFRRLFWIFVCLSVLIFFIVQLTKSIIKYYEYGTTTDVQVIYEDSVLFPAVTLCNQNNFRTTASAEFNLYDYIDDIFSRSKDFNPDEHDWENVNMTDFINKTAHQLEDFIDSCSWSGKDCTVTDFVRVFTGIGMCYTFNGGSNPRIALESGSSTGLSLVLNVEQYEYMRGPNSDAGIKVLLHDPADKPEMTDQGFVVAPGTHTLVTILQKKVTSLPPPWGTCEKDAQPYHTCRSECKDLKVANMCGCRDVYMSKLADAPEKYCTMNESFICIRNAVELIRQQKNDCNCNVTCERTVFEPSLSYAMLSEFNIDQVALTTKDKKDAVKLKFEAAMEKQQRVVESIKTDDLKTMTRLLRTARSIANAMNATYTRCLNTTTLSESYIMPDVLTEDQSLPSEDVAYAKQYSEQLKEKERQIEINFWETKNDLDELLSGIFQYSNRESEVMSHIEYCIDEGYDGSDVCQPGPPPQSPLCSDQEMQFICILDKFHSLFLETAIAKDFDEYKHTAMQSLSRLQDYNDVVNWTFAGQTLDSTEYADHYECYSNLETYQNTVLPDYLTFIDTIDSLYNTSTLLETYTTYTDLQSILDTKLGPYLLENDTDARWDLPHGGGGPGPGDNQDDSAETLKCSWYSDIYRNEIEPFSKDIDSTEGRVSSKHNEFRNNYNSLVSQLLKVLEHYDDDLADSIEQIQSYLDETITKKELAEVLSDQELTRSIAELSTMNNDLISAVKNFETVYKSFPNTLLGFYETLTKKTFPYMNNQTKAYYPFLQQLMTWYNDLGGKDVIEQHLQVHGELNGIDLPTNTSFTENNIWLALADAIEGFKGQGVTQTGLQLLVSSITRDITNPIKTLLTQLDTIVAEMTEYKEKIAMNTAFYLKNFLQLDIFYKELSYDTIEQQKAFQFESLLGEVGGFLGLLLGASVVTICELLDYIVMHTMVGCKRRKKTDVNSFSSQADLHQNDGPEKMPMPKFRNVYE